MKHTSNMKKEVEVSKILIQAMILFDGSSPKFKVWENEELKQGCFERIIIMSKIEVVKR